MFTSCLEKLRTGDAQPTCSINLLLCGHGGDGIHRDASLQPGRAVDNNTWAGECYLMMCCCSDRQGTGQAVRAGHRWGQQLLHGSTWGCCVLVDRWVLLLFSYLFPHETGAWARGEREDRREGWQVEYPFLKWFPSLMLLLGGVLGRSWAGWGRGMQSDKVFLQHSLHKSFTRSLGFCQAMMRNSKTEMKSWSPLCSYCW